MKSSNTTLPTIPIVKRLHLSEPQKKFTNNSNDGVLSNNSSNSPRTQHLEASRLTQVSSVNPGFGFNKFSAFLQHSPSEFVLPAAKISYCQSTAAGLINALNCEIERLFHTVAKMSERLEQLEQQQLPGSERKTRKRRRRADEIQKVYKCSYEDCFKTYGTEVSLNLHIKLKHNGGTKTEREEVHRLRNAGQDFNRGINLPPMMMESIKENTKQQLN